MPNKNCNTRQPVPPGSLPNNQFWLVQFDGYWWWLNYPFNIAGSGYWFNGQQWDPRLITAEADGLHLKMQKSFIPGAPSEAWSSCEAVLWSKVEGPLGAQPPQRFYPGFGTYLVAASTSGSFNELANHCCFGAFTYAFEANPGQTNQHHELDMTEISRWGNLGDKTNAQFTLQPWEPNGNVHRITLADKGQVTLVMNWAGAGVPVTFSAYYGIFDLDSLPAQPDITWTTSAAQNKFIPADGCQTVHFNLWRQPPDVVTDPGGNREVVVRKFQYRAI